MSQPDKLTKADTVSLWHAVDAYALQFKCMQSLDSITPELIATERERVLAAKRALRKVNKLRRGGH